MVGRHKYICFECVKICFQMGNFRTLEERQNDAEEKQNVLIGLLS